jgi:molecular chaperone GrpE (heat shock protein)
LYGDPLSPETYDGARTYEAMAAFAKENISTPTCNVFNPENCSDAEKQTITLLKGKTQAELEALAVATEKEVKAEEGIFDKDVEDLQKKFDNMVTAFNEKLEGVKKEHNYKFVEQILSAMDSAEDKADGGDEL